MLTVFWFDENGQAFIGEEIEGGEEEGEIANAGSVIVAEGVAYVSQSTKEEGFGPEGYIRSWGS